MFAVSYQYTDSAGYTTTVTDLFRDKENAITHAEYIRQHHHVIAIVTNR